MCTFELGSALMENSMLIEHFPIFSQFLDVLQMVGYCVVESLPQLLRHHK
jgi:hypothetical protein